MSISLSLDRLEGAAKELAVLVTDDGLEVHLPKGLLPAGVKPGDVLRLDLEKDAEATQEVAREAKALQEELRKTDPGGEIDI